MSYAIPITPTEMTAYEELRAHCNARIQAGETKQAVQPDYDAGLHGLIGDAAERIIEGRGHLYVPGDWRKMPARKAS